MFRKFHIIAGLALVAYYIYAFIKMEVLYPLMAKGIEYGGKAVQAFNIVYILAICAFICLLFPDQLSDKFSPKSGIFRQNILNRGFWRFFGYVLGLISLGILQLFK